MTQHAPPLWPQTSPGAQPGPHLLTKRFETLGTVALVLSIGELLYCAWRLMSPLLSSAVLQAQRSMAPTTAGVSMAKVTDAAQVFMVRIQLWEAVRTVPYLVATGVLLWIALRLRKGEEKALTAARIWSLGALGAVAISLVIQIVITVPATMEYQRAVVELMPGLPTGGAAPFDVKAMTSSITMISSIIGVILGTMFLAAWPIVLYFWASKLGRDAESLRAALA